MACALAGGRPQHCDVGGGKCWRRERVWPCARAALRSVGAWGGMRAQPSSAKGSRCGHGSKRMHTSARTPPCTSLPLAVVVRYVALAPVLFKSRLGGCCQAQFRTAAEARRGTSSHVHRAHARWASVHVQLHEWLLQQGAAPGADGQPPRGRPAGSGSNTHRALPQRDREVRGAQPRSVARCPCTPTLPRPTAARG